jgi:hypothetical protein
MVISHEGKLVNATKAAEEKLTQGGLLVGVLRNSCFSEHSLNMELLKQFAYAERISAPQFSRARNKRAWFQLASWADSTAEYMSR